MSPEPKDAAGTPERLKPGAAATVAAAGTQLPPETPEIGSSEAAAPGVDMADLKRKSVRGGAVTMASQGVTIAIQLASTVILARLLSPEDYGIIAMVMAVTSFAGLFRDLGLSSAAIQKKDLSRAQQSNLFWLNVGMGTLLTILVAAASPLVVWFYGKPELLWVTVALSFNFLIGSFGAQHGAMLVRNMQFGRKAVASISGSLVTLVTAATFAIKGFSYWSLVWGNLAGALITTFLLFVLSPFRPGLMARSTGIREMLKFGANITAFDFVNYFAKNLDNILIGRFWGAAPLGVYSRAYQLLMLPINTIRSPIQSVAFTVMSKIDCHSGDFRRYYNTIIRLIATISMPITGWLFVASEDIVLVALGEQWIEVAPIFRVLAIAAFIQPVSSMRGLILLSTGQGSRYLRAGVISSLTVGIAFTIGVQWGAVGVASSYAVSVFSLALPMHLFCCRGTSIQGSDLFRSIRSPAIASLTGVLATLLMSPYLDNLEVLPRIFVMLLVAGIASTPTWIPYVTSIVRSKNFLKTW